MSQVTQILAQIEAGNPSAAEELLPRGGVEVGEFVDPNPARESPRRGLLKAKGTMRPVFCLFARPGLASAGLTGAVGTDRGVRGEGRHSGRTRRSLTHWVTCHVQTKCEEIGVSFWL